MDVAVDATETPNGEDRPPDPPEEDGLHANAAFDFAQDPPAPAAEDEPEVSPAPQSTAAATETITEAVEENETETAQSEAEPAPAAVTVVVEPEPAIPAEPITQALEAALETSNLEAYRSFIQTYQKESGRDLEAIAAALAAVVGHAQRKKTRPQRDNKAQAASERRTPEEGMAQYRIEVGRSDGVQPRNIVGALTNEAELGASDIGYIKIFDRFSLVELPDSIPQEELEHLAEVWVCGRKMGIRVDNGPPENESKSNGKAHPPRRDKRAQGGRDGASRNDRDRGSRPSSRDGGDRNGQGHRRGRQGGQGGGRNRGDGARQNARGANPKDDNFGNRIDYTPKDRGRLHNIIYGDGIANVGQENGPGGAPLGLSKGRRNGGGGAKGNRGSGGGGFNGGRGRGGGGGGASRRRRQD